jgi:hypothetical protein
MWLVACRQSREIAESFKATCDELIAQQGHNVLEGGSDLESLHRAQGFAAALRFLVTMIDKEDNDAVARSNYTDKLRRTA